MYSVKEIYRTLQGEGANTGRAAVFCRFAGCNLWSGVEADREKAVCQFCDTEFVGTDGPGGGRFKSAEALAEACTKVWGANDNPFIVLTGGEPMLQVDLSLIDALHNQDFEIAIESNGTLPVPRTIDWICGSPKAGAQLVQTSGDELKLVYPQAGAEPDRFRDLDFRHFFLQPMDCAERDRNTKSVIAYCQTHPQWRLSLQTHKLIGIP